MRRREFITCVGALLAGSSAAFAQRSRMLRVASSGIVPRTTPFLIHFEKRMAELGYRPSENFIFDYIQINSVDHYPAAYRELAARGADCFLASGNHYSLEAARSVADDKPVVFIAIDYDPIKRGYVNSLARPGKPMTGLFLQQIDLMSKRLDLLRSTFPNTQRAGVFWDSISADQWKAARDTAPAFGLELEGVEVTGKPYDFEAAFLRLPEQSRRVLIIPATPFFLTERARLATLSHKWSTALICAFREYVDAGAFFSYGPRFGPIYRRAAEYVDLIAKGTAAADLPIEQPTAFELVINLETARKIGVTVPPSLLARADEVIE